MPTVCTVAGLAAERAHAQAQTALPWRKNAQPPQVEPDASLLTALRTDIIEGPAATIQRFTQEAHAAGSTYDNPFIVGMRCWQASLAVGADVDIVDLSTGACLCPGRVEIPLATAGYQIPDTVRVAVRMLGPVPEEPGDVMLRPADVNKLIFIKLGTGMLQPPGMARLPDTPTSNIRL